MGDRWNIHNDQPEAERYRREVPLRLRIWNNVKAAIVVGSIFAIMFFILWRGRG